MIKMPLCFTYYYDEESGLYEEIGTHRTITPAEYEALEAEMNKSFIIRAKFLIGLASVWVIFVGLMLAGVI